MFEFVRKFIKKTMEPDPEPEPADYVIKTIDIDSLNEGVVVNKAAVVPVVAKCEYACEMDVIHTWKVAAKDNIKPLIAMIRHLYFFSDCRKETLRTYALCKEDISSYVGKIKRRPELQIYVSDINVYDHPLIFNMFRRLRAMIGMFRVNDFMVRVEHAFNNSQIRSEFFVVAQMIKVNDPTANVVGIDPVHHIVLPTCVQLNNIREIPVKHRTLFHHISYSIQPIVFHSKTMDTWFKSELAPPTTEQLMRLCIQMAEALTYLHASGIVHGDIKPGNTLIQTVHEYADDSSSTSSNESESESELDPMPSQSSLSLYLIDFGMSGNPGDSDGTGGTKPFCAPETGNGFNPEIDMDTYTWTKNQKHHDVWSFALIFFTMIVLHKSTSYPRDYPSDFFEVDRNGHINPAYFDKIQDNATRDLFRRALCPAEERITAAEFLAAAAAAAAAGICANCDNIVSS